MLLPQTSPYYQSHLPLRTRIVLAPVKAFHLSHCQGLSRLLPVICSKRTLQRIRWRWGNQDSQCRRKSDWGTRQMRINAVLSTDPGMVCSTSKAADSHAAELTNSPEQTFTVNGNRNVALFMGATQNQGSLNTAQASAVDPSFGRLDFKEAEKQRQEVERLRRKKISEANKGRTPWNKGRKGEYKALDEGSTSQLKVVEPISQEEREKLRRQRISKANRGKVPWNKGGKHSPETKHRIREGVIERMKDPKIREKLRLQAEAVRLSPEVRQKIKIGIIKAWSKKRRIKAIQEHCLIEWQEMIAEMARIGCEGDVVYQWDSYSTIKEEARLAWRPPLKKQRAPRADHSIEHRMRISAAIKAKWSDPNYRVSVQKGIREFMMNRGTTSSKIVSKPKPKLAREPVNSHTTRYPKANKLPKNRVRRAAAGGPKNALRANLLEPVVLKPNIELPQYKDPETKKKLEKLVSMRAHRMYAEAQKQKEITERARTLILQAGEAAKALEAAAVKDKNALAPLLETRKLLAEAVRSLESMNRKKSNPESIKEEGSSLYAHVLSLTKGTSAPKGKGENHLE